MLHSSVQRRKEQAELRGDELDAVPVAAKARQKKHPYTAKQKTARH